MQHIQADEYHRNKSVSLTVLQALPALEVGGVERGTLEIAAELVRHQHRSIVISAGGSMVEQLAGEGSEHLEMPIGKKSPISLLYVKQLRKMLIENQVDILHARSRMPAWICYLAWRGMDTATRPHFLTTVHGPYTVNKYSAVMTYGERVIAISHFIKDYILKNYPSVNNNKIEVIYRGVDQQQYWPDFKPDHDWLNKWQADFPWFKNKYLVTLPARITHWKGHEDFICIINKLIQRGVPAHGIIAGGYHPGRTRFYNLLNKQIAALGLEKSITFIGHRHDLKEVMSVSQIILSLAKEPEAFGRTALEALSLGVPVIAYDHGGATEVLAQMFPPGRIVVGDTESAVNKIEEFYHQPPLVTSENPFTLQHMLNQTLGVYTKIAGID